MNQYYFYILHRDFGLCFIKLSSHAPFTVRVWLNGHEWAKRGNSRTRGSGTRPSTTASSPATTQRRFRRSAIASAPEHIGTFFREWLRRLPPPFTAEDRKADFRYELSILQPPLRRAWNACEKELGKVVAEARLAA